MDEQDEITETHRSFETAVAVMIESFLKQEVKHEEQAEEGLKVELDTSLHRASTSADQKGESTIITNLEGFDRLKTFQGDRSQWDEWRLNITTWLAQVNATFNETQQEYVGARRTRSGQIYVGRTGRAHHGGRMVH